MQAHLSRIVFTALAAVNRQTLTHSYVCYRKILLLVPTTGLTTLCATC
jgi:hypothetical protein